MNVYENSRTPAAKSTYISAVRTLLFFIIGFMSHVCAQGAVNGFTSVGAAVDSLDGYIGRSAYFLDRKSEAIDAVKQRLASVDGNDSVES